MRCCNTKGCRDNEPRAVRSTRRWRAKRKGDSQHGAMDCAMGYQNSRRPNNRDSLATYTSQASHRSDRQEARHPPPLPVPITPYSPTLSPLQILLVTTPPPQPKNKAQQKESKNQGLHTPLRPHHPTPSCYRPSRLLPSALLPSYLLFPTPRTFLATAAAATLPMVSRAEDLPPPAMALMPYLASYVASAWEGR